MEAPPPTRQEVLQALIGSGFANFRVNSAPNYNLFRATRVEQLDNIVNYAIAVSHGRFGTSDVEWLIKDVKRDGDSLILVGTTDTPTGNVPLLTHEQFFGRLGGPIFSTLPFDEEFGNRLIALGHNKLPNGLSGGRPDDLFEQYVHVGLQFLFRGRVLYYGQDRRGEPVPDGIAVSRTMPLTLYDAKAYGKGFPVEADDVRRFADYANDFTRSYETMVGAVGYFLVISGSFVQDQDGLESRARMFRSKCNSSASISFMTAEVLGGIVKLLVKEPLFRPSINWGLIFERPLTRLQDVEKQLQARKKDRVLPTMNNSL